MVFAEFYHMSVPGDWNNNVSKPIPACGDRAVIILDGRRSRDAHLRIAREECKRRGYIGFKLHSGESFTRSKELSPYVDVS